MRKINAASIPGYLKSGEEGPVRHEQRRFGLGPRLGPSKVYGRHRRRRAPARHLVSHERLLRCRALQVLQRRNEA